MEKTAAYKISIFSRKDILPDSIIRFGKKNSLLHAFEIAQSAAIKDVENKIISVCLNDIPIAVSFYQIVTIRASHLKFLTDLPFLNREMFTATIQVASPKLIVFGNLYLPQSALISEPSVNGNTGYFINKMIEGAIQKEKPFIVILKEMPVSIELQDFVRFDEDAIMIMNIREEWKKMDDYISSLRSKYRKAFFTTDKKFITIVKKDLSLRDLMHYQNDIERLYLNVAYQGDVSLGFLTGEYFINVKKVYNDSFKMTGFFSSGKLIGFSSYFLSEHEMTTNYIGIDYSCNEQFNIYFNILYEYVRQSILIGKKTLNLGRTSFDAKARLGGKPISMDSYYKIINPVLRPVIDAIINKYKQNPEEKWKRYNPLGDLE
ncbi:MAG: hypothetical protein H7Y00_06280 [Fimbriimonadaceae bacterium]|nr:hypothetical protein [Chitinophagales bacterium]